MESITGLMVLDTKVIGSLTRCLEKVFFNGVTVVISRVSLRVELCMEKEDIRGRTAGDMKVNIVAIRSMAKAHTHIQMVVSIQENG